MAPSSGIRKLIDSLLARNKGMRRMLLAEIEYNIEVIELLNDDVPIGTVINNLRTESLEKALDSDFDFRSFSILRDTVHPKTARNNPFYERYVGKTTEDLFISICQKIKSLKTFIPGDETQNINKKSRLLNIYKLINLLLLHLNKKRIKEEEIHQMLAEERESKQSLNVFLCHSSGDKPKVWELYHRLRKDGVDPWLDKANLLPGQCWRDEIPKAVEKSDVVIVCLSKKSITKAGYYQKEIKWALDEADKKPEGTIFLIPLKFEECEVPSRLEQWQWVDYFDEGGYELLKLSLRRCAQEKN